MLKDKNIMADEFYICSESIWIAKLKLFKKIKEINKICHGMTCMTWSGTIKFYLLHNKHLHAFENWFQNKIIGQFNIIQLLNMGAAVN